MSLSTNVWEKNKIKSKNHWRANITWRITNVALLILPSAVRLIIHFTLCLNIIHFDCARCTWASLSSTHPCTYMHTYIQSKLGVGAGMLKPLRDSPQPPGEESSWLGDYITCSYIKVITSFKHEHTMDETSWWRGRDCIVVHAAFKKGFGVLCESMGSSSLGLIIGWTAKGFMTSS